MKDGWRLGGAGRPRFGRMGAPAGTGPMTTSLAVRLPDALFLFDAGVGLAGSRRAALSAPAARERGVVHLFLSHLHLDHTVGLTFLPALWQDTPLDHPRAWRGDHRFPGGDRAGPAGRAALLPPPPGRVPHAGHGDGGPPGEVEWRVGGCGSSAAAARRVARWPTASTTCSPFSPTPSTIRASAGFARGVASWCTKPGPRGEEDPEWPQGGPASHTSAEEAARVARDAGVRELLLSHLTPLR